MRKPLSGKLFINGNWIEGGGSAWERRSPAYEQTVWSGKWANSDQCNAAVDAARGAFHDWADRELEQRIEICQSFATIVTERQNELAELIATENGKPMWEAKTEVAASIGKVTNSVEAIKQRRWTITDQIGDFRAVTRFRPHGVMFVIGPFNFPTHVPGGHIIPALLAGNTLIFKPSEWVPATGQWLCQVWEQAGLPPGVLNLVHGAGEVGNAIVERRDVDGILFTGSQRVGEMLHKKLAGQTERVLALEMGGNNPLVVHNVSDPRAAAITTILSAFITAGQRCTCSRRLIVTGERGYQELKEQLLDLIPKIRCGKSLDDPQPFMGPMIHGDAASQMLTSQRALMDDGAKALIEMKPDPGLSALLSPGLLEIPTTMQRDDCEYFGPMLMLERVADLDEAIERARSTRYGLSAGFLGDSFDDFHRFLHRVPAGIVNWNRQTTGASGKLPFGGVGVSGNHHPSGFFAADYCSYPIASLESEELSEAKKAVPGLEFE